MKAILLSFFLLNLLISIGSNQNQETVSLSTPQSRYFSSGDEGYIWKLIDTLYGTSIFGWGISIYGDILAISERMEEEVYVYKFNGTNFEIQEYLNEPPGTIIGNSLSIYEDILVVGSDGTDEVFIYRNNDSHFESIQNISGPAGSRFGARVSVYENALAIGAYPIDTVFIYRKNDSYFENIQNITGPAGSYFGWTVSVYENVLIVGAWGIDQVFIYRYNESNWNFEQNFTGASGSRFGYSVSVYGYVFVVGAYYADEAFIYKYNETSWNLEQNITGASGSGLGRCVSVYEDVVVGTYSPGKAFLYRYNGNFWYLEEFFNQTSNPFGSVVTVHENFTAIIDPDNYYVCVYQCYFIPQVNIHNCSSLFSSFDCYWDQIECGLTLKYQINYGYDWIDIDSPILEDGNVYYQLFNSSIYDNITGNEYYPIQIHACDVESLICGKASSFFNLTTRIDSVKDFQLLNPTSFSINVTWNHPNVSLDEDIAHLDHYNLSYFTQCDPESVSSISIDNSSTSYLLDIECGNDYNVSICGCRTHECEGEDKGEVVESSISIPFQDIQDLTCSIQYALDINCSWNQPINCSIPSYYNFSYQAISEDESGNENLTSSNQYFTNYLQNQEYQINVSACNSMNKCSNISTTSATTGNLTTSPTIYETISKIEEIEFNFTKLTNANNYSISLNNETNWQNFTSLDLSGSEGIGIINELSGNIEYNISVRGCSDLNCKTEYLGESSSIISTKAKLGNITSLSCSSLICGFECTWDSLNLSTGLKAYSFRYNSTTTCFQDLRTSHSILSGLIPSANYEISVYSSATTDCSYNEYSGIETTTIVTTDNLPAPTINQLISKIEEIEIIFTKVTGAYNYSISLNNGTNWQNFTSLDLGGSEGIGIINELSGNIEYNISVRGCSDLNCKTEYLGESSSINSTKAKLGNITSLSCSSLICGFEYLRTSHSILSGLIPSANYEISVYSSATTDCSYNEYSGIEITTIVTTDNLPAPTINQLISKIEEIEIIFTKVTGAYNYSISLNNGTNWQNFTSLDLGGSEGIGTINELSGNIEYNISVRGCSDLNCKTEYLGDVSSINSTKAKLGNITSLSCYGIFNGFVCTWDSLNLTEGLKAYSFRYNLITICFPDLRTYYLVSGVNGGENYEISVYSSATSNCYYNENSGIETTTSVTTLSPTQTSESSSKAPIIALAVIVPVLVIVGVIIVIVLIKKQKKSIKTIIKQREKELEKSGGIEMI
ncbi:hypothetical protein M0811_14329 [Anaeramoeba ignava]|uniref:Fibronectin type-III domain-containing protein n=1 Tax=Anaeramoeba ignava TaxID=1746090 RepID=A0A9Q0LTY2_ANAIG|nr:hypothetical protein M0811_14329 [Anaeramoeba ignava]